MSAENYLFVALDRVLAWEVPDELLPITLQSQAGLMAGVPFEETATCFD